MPDRRAPTHSPDTSNTQQAAPSRGLLLRALKLVITIILILILGVGALAAALRFAIVPNIDTFRPKLETLISQKLGVTLRIQKLAADWQGLSPAISITGLTIDDKPGTPSTGSGTHPELSIDQAHAVFAWRSLLRLKPILTSLEIKGADVVARRDTLGKIHVAGITLGATKAHSYAFSNWLLLQRAIVLRAVTVRWLDAERDSPPLAIQGLNMALLNQGTKHHLGLQGAFSDPALGKLDVRADFQHERLKEWLNGEPMQLGNPHYWRGRAYVASNAVDLTHLSRYIDLPIAANSGTTGVEGWINFADGKIDGINGQFNGQHLALRVDSSLPALDLPHVAMQFEAHKHGDESTVALRNVSVEVAGQPGLADGTPITRVLNIARFDGAYRTPGVGAGERIRISGDVVDIGLLADISRALPLPERLKRNIGRYNPRGILANYAMEWERHAPSTEKAVIAARTQGNEPLQAYTVSAQLDGVSLQAQPPAPGVNAAGHPHIGQPGFHNLDGEIHADQDGGHLELASSDATLTIPGMFEQPTLPFDILKGTINWQVTQQEGHANLDAHADNMIFSNPDVSGKASARFQADLHAAHDGHLDVSTVLDRASVPAVPRYLPTSIGPQLRHYLAHAFSAGVTTGARVEAHGRLSDLPYPHGPAKDDTPHAPSQFSVDAPFTGGTIDITPYPAKLLSNGQPEHWPAVNKVNGRFFVNGSRLGFDVDQGFYKNVKVQKLTGRIDDLGRFDKPLVIAGQAAGQLADLLTFVNESPLGYWTGHFTAPLRGEGNAALAIRLEIPRHPATANAANTANVARAVRVPNATPAAGPSTQVNSSSRPGTIGVKGALTFHRNRLTLNALPPLDQLDGTIAFTQHTAQMSHLKGRLLGGDVTASGNLRQQGDLEVDVNGTMDPHAALQEEPDIKGPTAALLGKFSGTAPYTLSIRRTGHAMPSFDLSSDLQGLGIDLPAPLHKQAGEAMPLSASWHTVSEGPTAAPAPGHTGPAPGPNPLPVAVRATNAPGMPPKPAPLERIDLNVGPIRASYLRRGGDVPEVIAGTIGINRTAGMPAHGVTATARFDNLDADAWRAVIASMQVSPASATAATAGNSATSNAGGTAPTLIDDPTTPGQPQAPRKGPAAWVPDRFDIDIDHLALFSRNWHDVILTGNRSATRGWVGQISSQEAAGSVEWQPPAGTANDGAVYARLSKLDVPAVDDALKKHSPVPTPATGKNPFVHYPAIDLIADRFTVSHRDLGKLTLLTHNNVMDGAPVWQVDKLDFASPAAQLHASGYWRAAPGQYDAVSPEFLSALKFKLDIQDGGALLNHLGLPATLRGGHGALDGALSWRGSPGSIDTKSLSGTAAIKLDKGQILKVNPGAARLLGVLSLQGLARYLQLDFKGLFGAGLAFDHLEGSATVKNGVATAHDFVLHTTPARVRMTGSANIPQETQDLQVTVVPNLNAGSASLAAAAINPLLGLGSLVAQLALAEPISRSLTRVYGITGTWSKPQVQRLDANRGNMPSSDAHAP